MWLFANLLFLALLVASIVTAEPSKPMYSHKSNMDRNDNNLTLDSVGSGTFEQLLDHRDPSKGTFSQRYW